MQDPEKILEVQEFRNYRNVRGAAKALIGVGIFEILAAIICMFPGVNLNVPLHERIFIIVVVIGLGALSIFGGLAAVRGEWRKATRIRLAAAFALIQTVVGLGIAIVMLPGMDRFLASLEKLEAAESGDVP